MVIFHGYVSLQEGTFSCNISQLILNWSVLCFEIDSRVLLYWRYCIGYPHPLLVDTPIYQRSNPNPVLLKIAIVRRLNSKLLIIPHWLLALVYIPICCWLSCYPSLSAELACTCVLTLQLKGRLGNLWKHLADSPGELL